MKVNGWITLETGTPQVGRQQLLSTCQWSSKPGNLPPPEKSEFLLGRKVFDIKTCCPAHLSTLQMFGLGNEERFPSITGQTYGEKETSSIPAQALLLLNKSQI